MPDGGEVPGGGSAPRLLVHSLQLQDRQADYRPPSQQQKVRRLPFLSSWGWRKPARHRMRARASVCDAAGRAMAAAGPGTAVPDASRCIVLLTAPGVNFALCLQKAPKTSVACVWQGDARGMELDENISGTVVAAA